MIVALSTVERVGLPGQKIGKRWRFHKDAVDEWVKHGLGTTPRDSGYDAQCGEERM